MGRPRGVVSTSSLREHIGTYDAAKLLNVSPTTIQRWIDDGSIQSFRTLGGHRRLMRSELIRFIQENKMPMPDILQLAGNGNQGMELLESMPFPIWLSGTDGKCTFFNKAWLELTGRTIAEELGDGWAEGVHAKDLSRCLKTYRSAFEARRPFEMAYRLRRRDGDFKKIIDRGAPVFDAKGDFTGYIGAAYEVKE